jgi:hypothetical protein
MPSCRRLKCSIAEALPRLAASGMPPPSWTGFPPVNVCGIARSPCLCILGQRSFSMEA